MAKDPYYLIKDDVTGTVTNLEASFVRWKQVSDSNPNRIKLRQEIETNCESLMLSLHEVERMAIVPVEKDPTKFGLDQAEVSSRRQWHRETRERVAIVEAAVRKAAKEAEERAARSRGGADRLNNAYVAENDKYIDEMSQKQQTIIKQQDKELEDISQHVVRIGEMGKTIGRELDDQSVLLGELDKETDTVKSRLEAAQRKITNIINKSGAKGQMYMIGGLIILLVVLLLLLFL